MEFTRSVSGSGAVTKISFFLDLRFLSFSIFAMASDLMILPMFSQQKVYAFPAGLCIRMWTNS